MTVPIRNSITKRKMMMMMMTIMLLYGLEVCPIKQRDIRSLDLAANRIFMKLFRTSDTNVVEVCRDMFHFEQPSATLAKRI